MVRTRLPLYAAIVLLLVVVAFTLYATRHTSLWNISVHFLWQLLYARLAATVVIMSFTQRAHRKFYLLRLAIQDSMRRSNFCCGCPTLILTTSTCLCRCVLLYAALCILTCTCCQPCYSKRHFTNYQPLFSKF